MVNEGMQYTRCCESHADKPPLGLLPSFKAAHQMSIDPPKLSISRAYNLALCPQMIYTKSRLISHLVSSKIYRQLEFQAVGNWWLFKPGSATSKGALSRLPNGREDIFQDDSIDNRAKRSMMRFLKFVLEHREHYETWESRAEEPLSTFLASQFKIPEGLQATILALTLSPLPPKQTSVQFALPRIERHLTSIGVFGPGFAAMFPKWGGGAEIAQTACRAGAVGGGVYVLGTGIESCTDEGDAHEIHLTDGSILRTRHLSRKATHEVNNCQEMARTIAIVNHPLETLFASSVEGAPVPAASVICFSANTLSTPDNSQPNPVYIIAHSGDTGECPSNQCEYGAPASRFQNA